jgi:integrase/recombinase XerD
MKNKNLLGPWVRRFLLEHLVAERNLSPNTQASYRDTLTLLLPFVSSQGGGVIDRMTVDDLTPAIVRKFLDHLEHDRRCSAVTRNQRLATIHSLARFIGVRSPIHLAGAARYGQYHSKRRLKPRSGISKRPRWIPC